MAYRELLINLMEFHSINSEFVVIGQEVVLSLREKVGLSLCKKKKKDCRENIFLELFLYFINNIQ